MHPLLARQLRRLGLAGDQAPDAATWHAFLERMSNAYVQADQDRYLLERSLEISSREMRSLYEDLKRSSQSELARERDKLRQTAGELERAKDAAEHASRAKSDFLANMSHELRTPLNAVLGFARVLARQQLAAAQESSVRHIVAAGEHMLALINDLLDLRRVEARRLAAARIDAARAIDEAADMTRPLFEEQRQALEVEAAPALPPVMGDHRALVQALVNLLANAAKFSPAGARTQVRARRQGDEVRIEVADRGPGIAPEDQARLFTYFEQLGAKHQHNMHGSGVGLALTRALMLEQGGAVGVESAPGAGSVFWLTLRCAPGDGLARPGEDAA